MGDDVRPCGCPVNAYHSAECVHGVSPWPDEPANQPTGSWRIFSDGNPRTTKVIAPNGDVVDGVRSLTYTLAANEHPSLVLEVAGAGVTVLHGMTAEIQFTCPQCCESIDHECKGPPF